METKNLVMMFDTWHEQWVLGREGVHGSEGGGSRP